MLLILLWRAVRLRCPSCGGDGIFRRFRMVESCPTCDHTFVREDGYWLGSMTVNIAITEAIFLAVLVGGMLLTWPDVPWTTLLIVSVAVNATVPFLIHPFARTIWVALDLGFLQRFETAENEEERSRRNAV